MSDISIPGITNNNGMNTSRMIDDLMEVERRPLRRLENQVETYEEQQAAWRAMGRTLGQLRDASRTMYGFENPFRERVAEVSDPSVLSASATRQAEEQNEELTVLQTAGRDRFASQPIDREFQVPAGRYTFSVGDEQASLRFGGGSLRSFSDEVNSRLEGIVQTAIVPDTATTQVLILEGQQEGREAVLSFADDAGPLMEQIGVMQPARPDQRAALLEDETLRKRAAWISASAWNPAWSSALRLGRSRWSVRHSRRRLPRRGPISRMPGASALKVSPYRTRRWTLDSRSRRQRGHHRLSRTIRR